MDVCRNTLCKEYIPTSRYPLFHRQSDVDRDHTFQVVYLTLKTSSEILLPIHKSCVLFIFFFISGILTLWDFSEGKLDFLYIHNNSRKIYVACTTRTEVAQLKSFVSQKYVFNLEISMGNWWFFRMKCFNSSIARIRFESNPKYLLADFSHNENKLFFVQFCGLVLGHQIKDTSSITKLQENVNIIAIISIFN